MAAVKGSDNPPFSCYPIRLTPCQACRGSVHPSARRQTHLTDMQFRSGASNGNVSTYKIIKPQLKHIYYSRAVRVKESQIPVCECQPFIGQCILFFHDESWHFNILLTELSTETNRR